MMTCPLLYDWKQDHKVETCPSRLTPLTGSVGRAGGNPVGGHPSGMTIYQQTIVMCYSGWSM